MKIDKEFLDEQIAQFKTQTEEFKANLNAVLGAIDLCEHFLKVLDMEEPKDTNRPSNEKGEKHGMAKRKKARNQKATGS